MVIVKIELWPHGQKDKAKLLGICKITNNLTGDLKHGNYDVELSHAGKYIKKKGFWKSGKVLRHRRSLSPYHLVYKAIKACLYPK